jgi:2-polyprenyl-3-methyl-5-hydroxy-6-metoxy-1,4-benzoquinol methylase
MNNEDYVWDEKSRPYSSKMGQYKTAIEFRFIEDHVKNYPRNSKILDIGGGSGRFSIRLIEKGFESKIIDSNEIAVKLARERGLVAECIDFFDLDLSDKYDIILAIELLSYIENKSIFFEKVHSLLEKEGAFIFTAANPDSWRSLLRANLGSKYKFHEQSLKFYLEQLKNHFEIIEVKGFLWQPFSLISDNFFIPHFAKLEKCFFHKFLKQSPWWLFACLKK